MIILIFIVSAEEFVLLTDLFLSLSNLYFPHLLIVYRFLAVRL